MDFDDKVVLVTGASGGIGRAICRRFAAAGAEVFIHYCSNPAGAEETRSGLGGDRHQTVHADLRDPAAIRAMVDQVVAAAGRLDVVVNNAGLFEHHPLTEVSYEEWQERWDRILTINLVGAANLTWCAARQMIRQGGGGRVINVSSRGAFRGEPDSPAYGASKAGMNAMSQSLAKALAPHGIFVYAVAPGFVETAMARPYLTGEMAAAIRNQSPLGRVATPDEVAYWVTCLAAEGAEFATGAIIDVNGASYLRT